MTFNWHIYASLGLNVSNHGISIVGWVTILTNAPFFDFSVKNNFNFAKVPPPLMISLYMKITLPKAHYYSWDVSLELEQTNSNMGNKINLCCTFCWAFALLITFLPYHGCVFARLFCDDTNQIIWNFMQIQGHGTIKKTTCFAFLTGVLTVMWPQHQIDVPWMLISGH